MVLGREKVAAIFSDVLICSNCIGMRFALIEAKLGIAKALRVVEIQKCEKTEVPLELQKLTILNSKNGIWIRVARRS